MSQDASDRVGARPLSAFSTAEIVVGEDEETTTAVSTNAPIGITPLSTNNNGVTAVLSDDTTEDDVLQEDANDASSILIPHNEHVFGLLQDPHADPPIEQQQQQSASDSNAAALFPQQQQQDADNDDSSEEEYHSPLEDSDDVEEETSSSKRRKPIMNASPYDYDINWDMVGHLRHDDTDEQQQEETQQQGLNTSLADAAAASMIASTTAAATSSHSSLSEQQPPPPEPTPPPIPSQQPFSFRKSASISSGRQRNLYRYQKYTNNSLDNEDQNDEQPQQQQDVLLETSTSAVHEPATTMSSEQPLTIDAIASELNESTASTSSGSTGGTPSSRPRRRRHARASSFSYSPPRTHDNTATTTTNETTTTTTTQSTGRISSLDSGMAAVRRWIRSRATGGSSRAARRWQREEASYTLGEEDLFALTHAGEDPRRQENDLQMTSADFFPSIILEEPEEVSGVRQRALSEPNNIRMRNFFFQRAAHGPPSSTSSRSYTNRRTARQQQQRQQQQHHQGADSLSLDEDAVSNQSGASSIPTHLSSAALNSSLFHSPQRGDSSVHGEEQQHNTTVNDGDVSSLAETTSVVPPSTITAPAVGGAEQEDADPNREARTRWIRINRRFQLIITVVALIFSLLLFAILVCWVVFTSAYVISIDKQCDVPLKQYFWLATLQLILDVFRTDIMRFIFRWDTHSNERIPVRVIMYNIAYLIYALLVLRMGIKSVFMADDSTCPTTARELYQSSAAFVSLSIAAWSTIVLGYLVPFCFVATLLTWNGYSPTADNPEHNAHPPFVGGVFPAAYSTTGAPPGCVDQLRTVLLEEFPDDYPQECCICMGDFCTGEVIVATECQHVFHKRCCEEWLRQARTCPVCRMDIPSSLPNSSVEEDAVPQPPPPTSRLTRPFPGREDFHQDVVGLLQILRRQETRLRQRNASSEDTVTGDSSSQHDGSPTTVRNESLPNRETELVALEEGRVNRQHSR